MIPNTIPLDPRVYNDKELLKKIPEQFDALRNKVHIALLGDGHLKFGQFELQQHKTLYSSKSMIENVYLAFYRNSFPCVSIVDGGYLDSHKLALKQGLKISNHYTEKCSICFDKKNKASKSLKNHLKSIFNSIKSVFKSAENSISMEVENYNVRKQSTIIQNFQGEIVKKDIDV